MDVCEPKRLKALDDENAKLKKLLAEQMLDAAELREPISRTQEKVGSAAKRAAVAHLQALMGNRTQLPAPLKRVRSSVSGGGATGGGSSSAPRIKQARHSDCRD